MRPVQRRRDGARVLKSCTTLVDLGVDSCMSASGTHSSASTMDSQQLAILMVCMQIRQSRRQPHVAHCELMLMVIWERPKESLQHQIWPRVLVCSSIVPRGQASRLSTSSFSVL